MAKKIALITGANKGIGFETARQLGKQGVSIIAASRNKERGIAAVEKLQAEGIDAEFLQLDVDNDAEIQFAFEFIQNKYGKLDILINNAGVQHVSPIETFPIEEWNKVISINLNAAFHAIRAVIPGMKARGWGRIISTASAHSLTASAFKSAYVAAKHGLTGLTKAVALEVATHGITVNCISPAYVWTPLVESQIPDTMVARNMTREQVINEVMLERQPTKQFVTPEQVAGCAVFLCSEAATQMTGSNLVVDGGWTAQ